MSVDNPAFDDIEEISSTNVDSNDKIIPYASRRSSFFEPFDSISMYTESTVPSEFVERDIEAYEYKKKQRMAALENDNMQKSNNKNIQYNLRVDKVVIVGGNENKDGADIEKPVSDACNEIITQKGIRLKFMSVDESKFARLVRKKVCYIPLIFFITMLVCGLSYLLYLVLSKNPNPSTPTTSTPGLNFTTNPHSTTTTDEPLTTPEILKYKIVKRNLWEFEDLSPIAGKYKLITPINKIILLNASTNRCETEQICMEYVLEQQQNAYPDYDDIRENFIIALDGTIFEGRGFAHDGETTCESDQMTCYNHKAISISFTQPETTDDEFVVNEEQCSSFCHFIMDAQEMGAIDGNYNLFNHNDLVSSSAASVDGFESLIKECSHLRPFTKIPHIIRRNETMEVSADDDDDDDLGRMFSTKVILTTTGGETCDTMETCTNLVQKFQEENIHRSNFIFGGDEFIFEDKNFDLAVNESLYDVLLILLIGNYSTRPPSQPLITRLNNEFLEYSMVLEKLPRNHKICITNEAQTLINAIRNSTKYDNFCNEQV